MAEIPTRDIRDPRTLRAMAHPVRLQILEELVAGGPATATELAERVGESPANCSWHLRQLARYGYVTEAGGGSGRQRPWKVVLQSNRWDAGGDDRELAAAGEATAEVLFAREFDLMRRWFATRREEPEEWRDAAFADGSLMWLTAAELASVQEEVFAAVTRFAERIEDPARRPPGARLVHLVSWGVPTVSWGVPSR